MELMTTKLPNLLPVSASKRDVKKVNEKKPINDECKHNWSTYGPVDRSDWIKKQIKPYPSPGHYEIPTFINDLDSNPIKVRYGFLNDGRKQSVSRRPKGEVLLPGAYSYEDFGILANKKPANASFKSSRRRTKDMLRGLTDVDLTIGPGQYDNHAYMAIKSEEGAEKMMVFRSKSKRFPSNEFKPKEGPAPTEYEVTRLPSSLPVTSSFRSRTIRFSNSYTKYPGPGTYDRTYESPPAPHVRNLGRQHGLFFSSTFCY